VNPGFGGQAYLPSMEPKIREVRALVEHSGRPIHIEVDGGIAPATVRGAAAAGADVLVAGSALFRDPQGLGHAVAELRETAMGSPPPPSAPTAPRPEGAASAGAAASRG
jgi:ribulose-phosphate 3-epimerase